MTKQIQRIISKKIETFYILIFTSRRVHLKYKIMSMILYCNLIEVISFDTKVYKTFFIILFHVDFDSSLLKSKGAQVFVANRLNENRKCLKPPGE